MSGIMLVLSFVATLLVVFILGVLIITASDLIRFLFNQ